MGELLGNMAGPGARLINPDRRRARIMQSRGARVLGDGPPSASTHAVGPSAPSTQHRYTQKCLQQHSMLA